MSKRFTNIPCTLLARTGICNVKHCGFKHSKENIAVCQNYIIGSCEDRHCKLSHEPAPHRMPDCVHFLAGVCASNTCYYRHATSLSKNAEICREFLKGFCNFGLGCRNLHKFHCPSWASTRTCSRGDSCWHYHEPISSRHERTSQPIMSSAKAIPQTSTSQHSIKGSQGSSTITYHRSGTTFNALNTNTINPLKYIRPIEPFVASSPYRKRKLVNGLEKILHKANTSKSASSSEFSFSLNDSTGGFYDEDKIEKTGFLPLVKTNTIQPTMPQHSSSPQPPSPPTEHGSTNNNNNNNKTIKNDSYSDMKGSKDSKHSSPYSTSNKTAQSGMFPPKSNTMIGSSNKNYYSSKPPASTINKNRTTSKYSSGNDKQQKTRIVRKGALIKSFIDFDEDKFCGFARKDGSIDFDGRSLNVEDIIPLEFLSLLH